MTDQGERFRYQFVIDHVRELVGNGLPRGSRLPTERVLAETLSVSRLTVRRALTELEGLGEVRRIQGSGTFVDGPSVEKGNRIRSFTAEMEARGAKPGASVLEIEQKPANAEVSWRLGVSPGEPVIEIRRLRTADGIPMSIETDILRAELVPGIEDRDLTGSLYALLRFEYQLVLASGSQTFRATTLEPDLAALLSVAPHSAALEVHHVTYGSDGAGIAVSTALYRGDRYTISLDLSAE